jgi:hypothetical protein
VEDAAMRRSPAAINHIGKPTAAWWYNAGDYSLIYEIELQWARQKLYETGTSCLPITDKTIRWTIITRLIGRFTNHEHQGTSTLWMIIIDLVHTEYIISRGNIRNTEQLSLILWYSSQIMIVNGNHRSE